VIPKLLVIAPKFKLIEKVLRLPVFSVLVFVLLTMQMRMTIAETVLPRIASINLCADQLLMSFADDSQILSLSNLSHERAASYYVERAREFPSNTGLVEEVLPLQPDLVLAGQFSSPYTLKLLRSVGLRVEQLPIANSIDDLYENFRKVAEWSGHPERGLQIIKQFKARILALSPPPEPRPRAAVYDPNGYTVGDNSLRGQALKLSGWHNVATDLGITSYGSMALETVISLDPDAFVASPYSAETWSRAQAFNSHPALKQRGLKAIDIIVPSAQTLCGGPWTIDFIETLEAQRLNLYPD